MAVFFFQQLYFSNILNLNMIEPCPSILATNPISGCSVWSPGLPTATTHLLVALNPCRTLLILPHIGDRLQPHSIPKVPRRGSGIKNNHWEHWCLLVHLPLQTLSSQKGMQLSLSSATKSAKSLSFLCKTGSMFNRFSSVSCQVFTKLYLFQIFTKFHIFTKYIFQIFTYWFNWYLPAYLISSW